MRVLSRKYSRLLRSSTTLMIELFDDFRDLLIELYDAGAKFVVLGGYAVAFHGHPRATKDLDVLVEPDPENARRVYAALAAFGAPLASFEVGVEDFSNYDGILQLGVRLSSRNVSGNKKPDTGIYPVRVPSRQNQALMTSCADRLRAARTALTEREAAHARERSAPKTRRARTHRGHPQCDRAS